MKDRKKDKGDDTEAFTTTFHIAYTGPERKFNKNNVGAIAFLQNSIRDTYNSEIVCDTMDLVLDSVNLNEQSFTVIKNRNRELATTGLRYSLINTYSATGRCKACRGTAKLLKNDAARRKLESHFRYRYLQEDAIASFNDNLLTTLTNQQDYAAFQVITGVSITNEIPVDWAAPDTDYLEGLNFTAPDLTGV